MSKRKCSYRDEWFTQFANDRIKRSVLDDKHVRCNICQTDIDISNSGVTQLQNHINSNKYKQSKQATATSQCMSNFLIVRNSTEEDRIIASEIAEVYHSVRHHHSYRSLECSIQLNCAIFSDSKIAAKISCARTKAAAIAVNVLAPFSTERVLAKLHGDTNLDIPQSTNLGDKHKAKPIFFSISTDASNHKEIKCYPVAILFFDVDIGIQHRLIGFLMIQMKILFQLLKICIKFWSTVA